MAVAFVPAGCKIRQVVSWNTLSSNRMKESHMATNTLYSDTSRSCIVGDSTGKKIRTVTYSNDPLVPLI